MNLRPTPLFCLSSLLGAIALAGSVMFLMPHHVLAHAVGASWNQAVGPNTIDVGYDPLAMTTGVSQRFDFILWKGATTSGEQTDYSHVWVRIYDDTDTRLATGIMHQPFGPTTLLYMFQLPGNYTLEASFRDKDSNDIAVGKFPFTISSDDSSYSIQSTTIGLLLVALVLCRGIWMYWRRLRPSRT